jgi:hypothetical protein
MTRAGGPQPPQERQRPEHEEHSMARHRSRAQLVTRGHGTPAHAAVDGAPCARPTPSARLSGMAEEWHCVRPRSLRKVSKTCAAPSAKALLHRAERLWESVVLIWTYDPVADSVASSGLARCIAPPIRAGCPKSRAEPISTSPQSDLATAPPALGPALSASHITPSPCNLGVWAESP